MVRPGEEGCRKMESDWTRTLQRTSIQKNTSFCRVRNQISHAPISDDVYLRRMRRSREAVAKAGTSGLGKEYSYRRFRDENTDCDLLMPSQSDHTCLSCKSMASQRVLCTGVGLSPRESSSGQRGKLDFPLSLKDRPLSVD